MIHTKNVKSVTKHQRDLAMVQKFAHQTCMLNELVRVCVCVCVCVVRCVWKPMQRVW